MGGSTEAQPYSASWWENQTPDQLQEFIRTGFSGGEQYQGAHRELERRAKEATQRANDAAAARIKDRANRAGRIAFSAALVSLIAAIGSAAWVLLNR